MIYLHLDPFEGLLCGCNDFAYIREVNPFGNEQTDFCDYCCVKAFGMLDDFERNESYLWSPPPATRPNGATPVDNYWLSRCDVVHRNFGVFN